MLRMSFFIDLGLSQWNAIRVNVVQYFCIIAAQISFSEIQL